ncbi:MAG: MiaB/RimO family radical SAM methylthiotransferase, partial [Proteobacteria bacterium]|nr:MiaB/RimO family radical SAM methylthiotransferase [Pseudomonadota bacterium]
FQDLTEKRQLADEIFAYIKVSEGCNQKCTYCIIPKLRGTQRSRPVEDICKEGKILVSQGIKEIILTAENTTDYGQDLNDGTGFETVLFSLSDTLNQMPNKSPVWIRYLYTHPVTLSKAVINVTASFKNICSYYDVPVQHASSSILKKMGRPYTTEDLYDLFKTIRELDPDASLRTTIIAGFPGETDQDFDILMKFIEDIGFDHLGVFTYSDSTDLPSHCLKDHVPEQIAEQRYDQLMAAQARISERVNQRHVGRIYDVLVEEHPEPGVYIGRTMFQAPEVDGMTFIYAEELEINTIVRVRITDAYEYDIAGELA